MMVARGARMASSSCVRRRECAGRAGRRGHEPPPSPPLAPPPRPKRSLGQNFLLDDGLARSVVERAGVRRGQRILEVGPGMGALTRHLVGSGAAVVAGAAEGGGARATVAHVGDGRWPRGSCG